MDHTTATENLADSESLDHGKSKHRTTSDIFSEIAHEKKESLTIKQISYRLGDRGFGLILLLFALPNCIPLPIPGISTITSLPMMFFAVQLCIGRKRIWLPEWMARREISMAQLQPFLHKSLPWLLRIEKITKPRLDIITSRVFERIAGLLIISMVCLLVLPIPLGNLPLGAAVAILALAITERDGVVMMIGWLSTLLALIYMGFLLSGYAWVMWQAISSIF